MDSIDVGGKWWLEEMDEEDELVPDEAVAGTLTYSPEHGVELELLGSFYRMSERHDDDSETEDGPVNIFGVTTEGEYVTILNCLYSGNSMSTKDVSFTTECYENGTVIRRGLVDNDSKYWKALSLSTTSPHGPELEVFPHLVTTISMLGLLSLNRSPRTMQISF